MFEGLTKQQKTMILVLLSGTILVILNGTLLSPALPTIMADTDVSATTAQWLTSAYSLVEACIIPLNAFLVGRFSTRKLFTGCIAFFAVAAVVAGMAPNFGVILLGRIMMALAAGIMMPMSFTLILLTFPRERRGSAMGTVGLIIGFAPAIGPSLSGAVVDAVGWRVLFFLVAVVAVLVVIGAFVGLKNYEGFEHVDFDAPSIAILAVGMVSLLYGVSSFTSSQNKIVEAVLIVVGLALLVIFCRRQTKLENPVLRISIMKTRNFCIAVILVALLQAAMFGSGIVVPIYVQQVMGQSAMVTGLLMMPGAVVGAVCGVIAGRLFDRFGVRGAVLFGSVLLALGALGVTLFDIDSHILMVALVYTVLAIGMQFLTTPINTWGINSLDNSVIQHANAITSTMNQVGGSFGTALIVSLTALSGLFAPAGASEKVITMTGLHIAFTGMCVMALAVVVCIVIFVRDTNKKPAPACDTLPGYAVTVPEGVPGVDRAFLVADVMNANLNAIPATATVREAIDAMRATETSGVPIVNDEGGVIGFISDGDIMKYLSNQTGSYSDGVNYFSLTENEDFWARLGSMLDLPAENLATKRVVSIDAHADAEDAFKLLSEKRIKKVPVVFNGKVVGTLSRRNIMNALATAEAVLPQNKKVGQSS